MSLLARLAHHATRGYLLFARRTLTAPSRARVEHGASSYTLIGGPAPTEYSILLVVIAENTPYCERSKIRYLRIYTMISVV